MGEPPSCSTDTLYRCIMAHRFLLTTAVKTHLEYFSFQHNDYSDLLRTSQHSGVPSEPIGMPDPAVVRRTKLHSAVRSLAGGKAQCSTEQSMLYMCMRMRESSSMRSHREPSTGYDCRCFTYFEPSTRDRGRVATKYSNCCMSM
jgi:hypothetical protein